MRIIAVRAKQDGVGHYRVSIPALALREAGHTVDILDNANKLRACNAWFAGYDIALLQKVNDPAWFELINTIPPDDRPKTVYEVDDLVTGLDRSNPSFNDYAPHAENFRRCIGLADALICSTEDLAAHYRSIKPNCQVVPNCLDIPGFREWDRRESRLSHNVVIGWLGGLHHVGDEAPMREGLRRVMQEWPSTVFAFCGNAQLEKVWQRSLGISPDRWLHLEPAEFDGYQTRISQFDIGVAPLRQCEFNRCKSDLRLLEYGAWGVPYVASNIAPYRRFHLETHGRGGSLCSSATDWAYHLTNFVGCANNRVGCGEALRDWVRKHRGSEACAALWENAFSNILSGVSNTCSHTPTYVTRNTFCPCGSGVKYKRCCSPAWG